MVILTTTQSQKHGFTLENDIRVRVFGLKSEENNIDKHDIPKQKNKYDNNENCSIKTTCSETICCSDILRFYNYNFNEKNTIIVIKYEQVDTLKILQHIYEIDYNAECHKLLFGDLSKEVIIKYICGVKTIPANVKGKEAIKIFDYKDEKKKLEQYNYKIQINPKIDSTQSRVQCSISNFEELLKNFITYKSPDEFPNRIRGIDIISSIISPPRSRGGFGVKKLKDMCRDNGIKRYSGLRKTQLIDMLTKNNINVVIPIK